MAMLPEIQVLAQPTAAAPRHRVAPLQPLASAPQRPVPQPNFVLRRLGVVVAVVATTIVSVVGMGSAGAENTIVGEPAAAHTAETADQSSTSTVIVQPGDTLWTIAERVAPGVDRREAVDKLAEIAGGSMLEVGQRLEIPAIFGE